MKTKSKKVLTLLLALVMVVSSVPITALATDNEEQTILETNIENVKFDYQKDEAFQASATVVDADRDKYEIEYECWQEFEGNDPVAAWYSDGASHGSLPALTSFENNKKYVYSIMLKPKQGYTFSIYVTMEVNGKRVSTTLSSNHLYAPGVKTLETLKKKDDGFIADMATLQGEIDVRLNTFDKDGKYDYTIRLKAKKGYCFSDSITTDNITLNGKSLPEGSYVLVLDEGETCIISYGRYMRTLRSVETVYLNGISTYFFANESPSFGGYSASAFYDINYQNWEEKDNRSVGISSNESENAKYNQLITGFEYSKTYIYGVSFKIEDLGFEEGYRFDNNTKLYINNEEITLTPDQVEVASDGMSIHFKDVLTMTPQPENPTPPQPENPTPPQPTVPEVPATTQPTAPTQPTQATTQTATKITKPKKTKIKKVKGYKKALEVSYAKVSGASGYQIQVATDKKFKKNKKTVTAKKSKTKVKITKLKKKKKYYVRVRAYKSVSGKKVYGAWSKVKTVKTK